MAKGKKKNQNKKSSKQGGNKKGNGKKKTPVSSFSMSSMAKVMETCSVTNPFCPEADNGKWPDNSYVKSNTWNISGAVYDLVTNGSGDAAVLFLPMFTCQYTTGVCTGNSVVPSATGAALQTMPTGVDRFRITSMGFKISCATAPMTTQGYCNIRAFSPMAMSSLIAYDKASRLADWAEDIPLHRLLDQDAFIIPVPMGDDAREWRATSDYSSSFGTWNNIGWQCIAIGVSGGVATTNSLRVECFYHYEFMFTDGNASSSFATPPPKDDLTVRQASASVIEKIGGVVRGSAKLVDNIAKSTAFKYLAAAGMSYMSKSTAPLMLANGSTNVD